MFFLLFICFIIFFYISMLLVQNGKVIFIELDLINEINSVTLDYLILIDWIRIRFISIVILISRVVIFYRTSYMSRDKLQEKFILLVFIFVISIMLIVIRPNLISILLGWDGLGLVSYCLVIYYQNLKSYNAGILTVLSNRLGDLAILIRIRWCLNFGSINLFLLQSMFISKTTVLVFILIIFAAITKRAQVPFSAWLPAAMAAPTPVSSLVHSSTLVTAGVYLLIRFNFFLSFNYFLLITSVVTITLRGIGAFFEMDLKKVIALSTLRQLGVMIIIISLGIKELGFFHLLTHALFKSLLFLCAGFYIHSKLDWQDVRSINKLNHVYPWVRIYFSSASLALSGFPFLAGFYSKDLIIEYSFILVNNLLIFIVVYLATIITLVYSLRLIYITFFSDFRRLPINSIKEDYIIIAPIIILFTLSVTAGSLLSWVFFPYILIYIPLFTKLLVSTGLICTFLLRSLYSGISLKTSKVIIFLRAMWNLPLISSHISLYLIKSRYKILKLIDQGWIESLGGQGLFTFISNNRVLLDKRYFINIKQIMFYMIIVLILLLIYIY